ncbi:PepSY-associated TM helix domain-containing protein [Caulifigura coniformis]|uniref:PepSY-associated TM helix domain-containing protein n=1 Tax=Caulifigura coniformis TaxID=2527983 RepID=UPI0011A5E533|nr:PepSY domain-containing protein [Caulifigura coniformis]
MSETTATTASGPRLYPVVWRWHFYGGLFTAPIVWILAITGALYAFRTELTAWRDHDLRIVTPSGERLPYDQLIEMAREQSGAHEIEALAAYPEPDRSIKFVGHVDSAGPAAGHERHLLIYIDPYTGKMLGSRFEDEDFFEIVLDLHRTLLMGSTGRILAELATSWGVVLIATGVFLWWPRGKRNVGVWMPRVRGKLYAVLRDWHAVTGAYLAPLILLVAGTGLFFTLVWGTSWNTAAQKLGQWPARWMGPPPKCQAPAEGASRVSVDTVVRTFVQHSRPGDAILYRFPPSPDIAHRAFFMQDEDKNSLRMVSIDPFTGTLIDVLQVSDLPLMFQMRVWSVSIHMGQILGTPTKILALIASAGLFLLSLTGVWMWWKRRPTGRSGFPRRPSPGNLPRWGWALIVVCGIAMPVVGLSFVVVSLLDWILLRRQVRAAAD